MAEDNFQNPGEQGGTANTGAKPGQAPVRKQRSTNLDTQSLKALAPSNEVARSALEMRQNLEKFVPPGAQRDQLIEQLKADVTPILSPELEAQKAGLSQLNAREQNLDEAIDRAAEQIRNKLGQFETFGPVKEVSGVAAATIEQLRTLLNDPRRNRGEFQIAIGKKDNKHFSSSRYFEPSPLETFAYERKTNEGLSDLQVSGYAIEALIHSHQIINGRDASHFSNADIEQADFLQKTDTSVTVNCFLLTPAPENILIVYTPAKKDTLPLGEAIGFFSADGTFNVRNDKYAQAFTL